MEKKSVYDAPEINVVILNNIDLIATSSAPAPDDGYSQYYPDPF